MAWEPKQAFHAYARWANPDTPAQSRPG